MAGDPTGVEDGVTIKVPGQGDAPLSGKGRPGDLLVRINVASSKTFKRQGANLYHEARIPVHTALLGGKVRVPTLDGEVDVRVPSGTQPGEQMMLKGHGIAPAFRSGQGDMFVTFNVQLPRFVKPSTPAYACAEEILANLQSAHFATTGNTATICR